MIRLATETSKRVAHSTAEPRASSKKLTSVALRRTVMQALADLKHEDEHETIAHFATALS